MIVEQMLNRKKQVAHSNNSDEQLYLLVYTPKLRIRAIRTFIECNNLIKA